MSWQRPRAEPSEEEIRRRRQIAVGAIAAAFLMLVFAVVLAVAGSGGDGNSVGAPTTTTTAKKPPARRRPQPRVPGFPTVPASAPGAHRAPTEAVPILVYTVINAPRPDTTNSQEWVPPAEFGEQMTYLATQDFHPVTLRQVWAAWKERGFLPSKPIVISFDVGYHSVYANALPVLQQHKWPATLFLQVNQLQADFPIAEVRALAQAGWELDSHGQTGADLTGLSDEELDTEVTGSRQAIRRNFGRRVDFFSYPGGRSDEHVVSAVEAAGYLGAATLDPGRADREDPFALKRIQVENGDGKQGLADKLSSAGVK
jgi:peptidoglycan/xylan/chitin deacetylase (PgdA/CDA1 family)